MKHMSLCQTLVLWFLVGISGCTSSGPLESKTSSSQIVGTDSYREGQIIHVATRKLISLDHLVRKGSSVDVLYLGEEHHHRFHIENAIKVLEGLQKVGRNPVMTIEMFGWDGQDALDRYITSHSIGREDFLKASRWKENWGGTFKDYEPLVQFAKDHHLRVLAMNPPRSLVRKVAKQGLQQALTDPDMVRWGMDREAFPEDPPYREKLVRQLRQCHGGMSDVRYEQIYQASVFRDEGMAMTIVSFLQKKDNPRGPVVSYTGGGHIQYQLPVPNRVKRRLNQTVRQFTVYMTSYQPDHPEYIEELLEEGIADYLWLTPLSDHGPPMRCGQG